MSIFDTAQEMSRAAAQKAAVILRSTIKEKAGTVFVAATGASQLGFLENLTAIPSVDWSKTTITSSVRF